MYLHHMVFRQLQMRPANNKLMNLEHDRIIWNDQTRELYQKRHIYSIIISEHSGNMMYFVLFKQVNWHTPCVLWHPFYFCWNTSNVKVVSVKRLALLKTRILWPFRTFPGITWFISYSTPNTIKTSSFWNWIAAVSSGMLYPSTAASRAITPT